ncbi:hypothetical protein [Shewanella youngdeokensis]|uniref:Uncharacterized protein n=1 Tax=Shewanella youngdeokensis TaxID=2999068 RepID=A0ABZ0JYZ6_9GAMM|nr:hypothetical protein RGE70_01380 [Shewanella sp. DAU334]
MEVFNISRITTPKGIFRLAGIADNTPNATTLISVTSLDILSTDGWQALAVSTDSVQAIIQSIQLQIIDHLQVDNPPRLQSPETTKR